jgi:uncharacterized protein
MTSIVSKGKDVKEAINVGLDLLGVKKEETTIEIIEREKRGFLHIGSKPAIVKISKVNPLSTKSDIVDAKKAELDLLHLIDTNFKNDNPFHDNHSSGSQTDLFEKELDQEKTLGKVWVEGGKVYCKSGISRYPTIEPGKGCAILKNSEEIRRTTVVTENDLIEIKTQNTEKETEWNINVDSSKLKVLIEVTPGYQITRTIPDIESDEHIVIFAIETKEVINRLSYEVVVGELNKLGVRHGFNHVNIMQAIETQTPGSFEIAFGVQPEPGKNGWFEALVEFNSSEGPKERSDGTVDFREIKSFSSVKKGEVIGIVHEPIPGVPGVTITNEPIPPKQTFPMVVREGKGVVAIENGKKIVATESGRPHIKQRGMLLTVSVMPKLVRNGNVDLESGNIRFNGDIDINGNVNDGMTVEAEGDIFITENVSRATITTNNAIQVSNNVIGSTLSAGKSNMMIAELGQVLGTITQMMDKMILSIEQLIQSPAFKLSDFSRTGIHPLIRILMEKKFQTLPALLKQFCDISNKDDTFLEEDWVALADQIRKCFLAPVPSEFQTIDRFRELSSQMDRLYEISQTRVEPNAYVTAMYALNSTIYSSGNVTIYGQGCFNTKINAGGKLQINGLLRGGELYGRTGIEVNEVGSDTGVVTKLSVPRDQKIVAKKVMEGTVFQIGTIKHKFYKEMTHVSARLSVEGQIIFN